MPRSRPRSGRPKSGRRGSRRAARDTRAKFLLTSRRDERAWLRDLPTPIAIPGMPVQERVQLARALADKHQKPFTEVEDWLPLLRFTGGNPLTAAAAVEMLKIVEKGEVQKIAAEKK